MVVCEDDGRSGALKAEDRPGLAAALVALEDGDAKGLVVHRLDRLARELGVQELALSRAWGAGCKVFQAVEGEVLQDDPDDPMRKALRRMAGVFGELERDMTAARLRRGRRRKAAAGGYVGGKQLHRRYGSRLVDGPDGKKVYEPVPEEQRAIERMRKLRDKGKKLREIAAELEDAEMSVTTPP